MCSVYTNDRRFTYMHTIELYAYNTNWIICLRRNGEEIKEKKKMDLNTILISRSVQEYHIKSFSYWIIYHNDYQIEYKETPSFQFKHLHYNHWHVASDF